MPNYPMNLEAIIGSGAFVAKLADNGGQGFNVMAGGARCDAIAGSGAAVTSGSQACSIPGGSFVYSDRGKTIAIQGAGAGGALLVTTISRVQSATSLTLAAPASTTVTSALFFYGTDDTSSIVDTAAFVASAAGTLVFPAGATSLVSNIALANLTGLKIEGGEGASLIGFIDDDPPLELTSCSRCTVQGLTICHASAYGWVNPNDGSDPAGVTSNGHGIALLACTDTTVRKNTIVNTTSAGIFCSTGSNVTIYDNRISAVYGTGVYVCNYQGGSADVSVTENRISGTGDDSIALIDVNTETQSVGLSVSLNKIYKGGARGIAILGPAHVVVNDNTINYTSADGILFGTDTGFGTLTASHVNVHDNDISNAGLLGTLRGNGIGIEAGITDPPSASQVHDNTIDTTYSTGISVFGAGNEVKDNHVLNAGGAGINVAASDQRYDGNTAEGCYLQGFTGTATLSRLSFQRNIARSNNTSQTASTNNFHLPNLINSVVAKNISYDANGYTTNAFDLAGGSTSAVTFEGNEASGTYIGVAYNLAAGAAARNNVGYNPVGLVTVAVPASGTAITAVPYDRTFYVTAGSSTCTMAIQNGPSPVIPASSLAAIRVPAGKTVTPTFTAAPTWLVEGE